MEKFIQNIPKAELHLHIEGTLEPELMFALAERNKIKLSFQSIDEVRKAYNFQNLQSFLDIYYAGAQVLLCEQDFYDLTWAYLQRAAEQNIRHTEIFFDPQIHTNRGVRFDTVVQGISQALQDGQEKLNISSKLIMCILRDLSEASAFEALQQAINYKKDIFAIGLDSAELNNPPQKFTEVFKKAREEGFFLVAHAGEEGPPDYIWQALELLQVQRIDHGVRCIEDIKLVDRLRELEIPLTVCPLSNIKLRVYEAMHEHPLKRLLDLQLCATVHSDDPAYFGGYINENFIAAQAALGLTKTDIYQLAKNSFKASFLETAAKQKLIAELDQFYLVTLDMAVNQ